MFRRRRGSVAEEGALALVAKYVKVMGYPDSLGQKIVRKYKRSSSEAKRQELDLIMGDVSGTDDEGALEHNILEAIPEKNRTDCYWFLYGAMMLQSAFFQGLGENAAPSELQMFLRGLCKQVRRGCLAHNQSMNLGSKNHGSIIFIRRGSLQLYLGDKMIATLGAGTVFDIGVLSTDRFGVFCQAATSGTGNSKSAGATSSVLSAGGNNATLGENIRSQQRNLRLTDKKLLLKYVRLVANSVSASAPQPEQFAYGCEYGVLTVEMLYELLEYDVNRPFKIGFTQIVLEERRRVSEAIGRHKTALENHRKQVVSENERAANKQLLAAAETGSVERVKAAVSMGANLRQGEHKLARTALHVAVLAGHPETVSVLLELGADPNAQDIDGCTPLHLACHQTWSESLEAIVEMLLAQGASATAMDSDLDTPFHYTAGRGETRLLASLVQSTSSWNPAVDFFSLKNNDGHSPFSLCATQQAKRLLKPRGNVDGGCR